MAEDTLESRTADLRQLMAWSELFRCFRVALDPKKLLLAAAGIVVMFAGWYLISWITFGAWSEPQEPILPSVTELAKRHGLSEEAAEARLEKMKADSQKDFEAAKTQYEMIRTAAGPQGRFRTMPWNEDRGPNPFLLVTGQLGRPWERGQFVDWFINNQVPVLIEPLARFLEPIIGLLSPRAGTWYRFFHLLITFWTLATWAFFGGAITRMATVELAGKDPVGLTEAIRFVMARYWSYLLSPVVPLGLIAILVIGAILFGFLHMIPAVGDVLVSGLLWPLMLLVGLGMTILLVGLVGYPLMYPTISAEGSDTLDALSRSYNYVYQSPWNYILYASLAVLYGAVVIFFVGVLGSMTAYLAKWGVSYTPGIDSAGRNPEYLFIYTPRSFGWRQLLLKGSEAEAHYNLPTVESELRRQGKPSADIAKEMATRRAEADKKYQDWMDTFYTYNKIGAAMVGFWVTLLFLMVLGFGYSFFWCTSTMIYLLLRRKVDDTDIDEVYLDEEEPIDPYAPPASMPMPTTPPPAPAPVPIPVDAPKLREPSPPPASPPPAPPPPATPPPDKSAAPPAGDPPASPPS